MNLRNERGVTTIEYAVQAALLLVVLCAAAQAVAKPASNTFDMVAEVVGGSEGTDIITTSAGT